MGGAYIKMSINNINTNKSSNYDSANNRSVNTSKSSSDFSKSLDAAVSNMNKTNLEQIFKAASEKYNVPENLLKAVAKAESNFNPMAQSSCGAQGVMQLMPATAKGLGVTDSFNAEQNIMGGAKYLSQLLDSFDGNTQLAVAAYNAGAGNVIKYDGIPPFNETQNYVKKVMQYCGEDLTAGSTVNSSKSNANFNSLNSLGNRGLIMPSTSSTKDDTANEILMNFYLYQLRTSLSQDTDSLLDNGEL